MASQTVCIFNLYKWPHKVYVIFAQHRKFFFEGEIVRRLQLTLFFQSNRKSGKFLEINLQSNSFNSVGAVLVFG